MAKILSISYDTSLLLTRDMLLRRLGMEPTSISNFAQLKKALEDGPYEVCVLGHSLPNMEKLRIYTVLKEKLPNVPVLELYKFSPDLRTGFALSSQAPTEEFLATIQRLCAEGNADSVKA